MSETKCDPEREGVSVECSVCHRRKKPVGRSAPLAMANSLCDRECDGYDQEPLPGTLWPGETCSDFYYAHSHDATRIFTPTRTTDTTGEGE